MNRDWKKWAIAALIRAIRTFAQSMVAMIGVGAAFNEVDWLKALSVSGVAFVLSILTSLATGLPEAEDEPEAEEEQEADTEKGQKKEEEPKPVERQVRIFTSRKDIVTAGEMIVLTSELIGFDNVVVNYQWQVDRGDGAGWVNVDGATRGKHTFIANKETIMYSWRLIVTTDD